MKEKIITTSWDDGQITDLRLIELLNKYKMAGTFYLPIKFREKTTPYKKITKEVSNKSIEIGGHTLNHIPLPYLSEKTATKELIESKKILENACRKKIVSFSYPNGDFNKESSKIIKKTGYLLARTTTSFYADLGKNRYFMPVSFQFYPHNIFTHLRHGFKEKNFYGILRWLVRFKGQTNLSNLAELFFEEIENKGGVFHIWGHSWEIDKYSLWSELEDVFKLISNKKGIKYLTNYQALSSIKK